ncbi:unnamed protein product, partial [Allacma fusca]
LYPKLRYRTSLALEPFLYIPILVHSCFEGRNPTMKKRWSSTRSLGSNVTNYYHDKPMDCGCQECYLGMLQVTI